MIIGITGTLGSGKGAIAEYLIEKGFKHFSVREFLLDIIRQKGMPENRDSMVSVGNELRQLHGSSYLVEQLYERAKFFEDKMPNSIIESIRTVGEVEALKAKGNFYLIGVDADIDKRYLRISSRASATDMVSFGQFQEEELREMASDDPTKQNLSACRGLADFVIDNSGSIEELRFQIDEILERIELEERVKKIESNNLSENVDSVEDFSIASRSEAIDEEKDFGEVRSVEAGGIGLNKVNHREDYILWDEYFMGIALLSAHKSKDPSTQVGACIVDENKKIVGIGYNGFPKGCDDKELPWERDGSYEDTKYAYIAHAELNAILNSSKKLDGCTMYAALFPCNECAKAIIQSGIKKIVYMSDKYFDVPAFIAGRRMFEMAGVELKQLDIRGKIVLDFDKEI
jgi:dCMP deaminase